MFTLAGANGRVSLTRSSTSGNERMAVHFHFLDHRRLASVFLRQHQFADALVAHHAGDRERALDGPQAAVERQLAEKEVILEVGLEQHARGAEDSEGDGEVEARAFFLHVGGRKVDGDVLKGKIQATVLDGALDALAAFAHCGVRQADGHEVRVASRDIDFHLNKIGIDPEDGGAEGFEKHEGQIPSGAAARGWILRSRLEGSVRAGPPVRCVVSEGDYIRMHLESSNTSKTWRHVGGGAWR